MKFIFLVACCVTFYAHAFAQSPVSFDDSIPSNWITTGTTPLSLSAEHYKGRSHSLKWQVAAGDTLKALKLNIPASAISSSSHWFVYCAAVSTDTLIIQFLDSNNVVKREAHMLLNYKGWREFHRNLKDDYNYGSSLPLFSPDHVQMIFRPSSGSSTAAVYIDEVLFTGYGQARIPGPHMLLDYQHFARNPEDGPAGNALASWLNIPDISVNTPTTPEQTSLDTVRQYYRKDTLPTPSDSIIAKAKNYVANCNITRNTDGSLKGLPIDYTIYSPDTLSLLSKYCGYLAWTYLNKSDTDAYNKLQLFTEHLLDQGLAEGGRNVMLTNDYLNCDTFSIGFLQALPVLTSNLRDGVIKMLKWSNEYNKIYAASVTPGLNVDYLYKKTPFVLRLICTGTSPDSLAVRDLKSFSRFLEQNTYASQGGRDGIKPDGTGFHHQVHYVTYMHAFNSWIDDAYALKGTVFKISNTAYANMSNAVKTLFLETNSGAIYANAECGRTPFPSPFPVSSVEFQKLVSVGGDLSGTSIDTAMASAYNYFFGSSFYAVPTAALDAFYQFNYAQLGVLRRGLWTVTMKGFINKLFGTEIYPTENRYGRYQSYGAVETLYNGNYSSTGYLKNGDGWDWNTVPGATTVQLPYSSLQCLNDNATEFQLGSFAGALSMGKDGIFGFDFKQDSTSVNYTTSNLAFHKSVFAFDTVVVCLGSGIKTSNSLGNVTTNLFQAVTDTTNLTIYINSTTGTTGTINTTLSSGRYLYTAQKTFFWVPSGNDSITVFRGSQSPPVDSSRLGNTLHTSNVSKAWISHGSHPTNAGYQYVMVLTAVKDFTNLRNALNGGSVYTALKKTDTLHAVKYIPTSETGYVFFQPASNVNIGYVKSISNKALVGIRESGDTIRVSIASPDLNTTTDSVSYWVSSPVTVSLTLSGNWTTNSNPSGAHIDSTSDSLKANFSLVNGLPASLTLIKKSGARHVTNDSIVAQKPIDKAALALVPNPASEYMQVVYTSPVTERVEVAIVTVSGQVLMNKTVLVNKGINTIPAPVTSLAAGIYTITVKGATGYQNKRFIKY